MDTPREPASQLEPPDASTQLAARDALGAAVAVPLQASSMQLYHRRRTQSAIIFFCCPRAPACPCAAFTYSPVCTCLLRRRSVPTSPPRHRPHRPRRPRRRRSPRRHRLSAVLRGLCGGPVLRSVCTCMLQRQAGDGLHVGCTSVCAVSAGLSVVARRLCARAGVWCVWRASRI